MGGAFETLNLKGLDALGLNPIWTDVETYTTIPDGADDGVYLYGSPKALGFVALRENVAKRTARVVITTAALTGTTYTVSINGNDVDYNSTSETPADADELVQGIVDAINNDGTVGPIVTASVDQDDEAGLTIKIVGDTEADYSIDTTLTGGTGAVTVNADACSCDVRFYATHGGSVASEEDGAANVWVQPLDGLYEDIDYHGFLERFDIGGCDRAKIVLENLAGHADDGDEVTLNAHVMIGPSVTA